MPACCWRDAATVVRPTPFGRIMSEMFRPLSQTLLLALAVSTATAFAQRASTRDSNVQSMTGVVTAVSPSSLTLEHEGHTIAFAVVSSTRVIGRGAGFNDLVYRTPPRRPKVTDLVAVGNRVTVKYRPSDGNMNAVEVRVTRK
jgi:hypothetical protein